MEQKIDLRLFHIFLNTPIGREALLQGLYFCQTVGASLEIYIPQHDKLLMYFDNDVVQVDLSHSYLASPGTARRHADELISAMDMKARSFTPKNFTTASLPDVPTHFDFFCCPQSLRDLTAKKGFGYIDPKVRRIARSSRFPILIPSPVYKPWQSVAVFFGGSADALQTLRLGLWLCKATGMRLDLFTQREGGRKKEQYEEVIKTMGIFTEVTPVLNQWYLFDKDEFGDSMFSVPHDALVVIGMYAHTLIQEVALGSMLKKIRSTLINNLLIVGPNYTVS